MKMLNRFIKIVSLSACVAMLTGMPLIVSADDTEIYVGSSSATSDIKPNVVFIIDTSGSMSTDETFSTGTYDPATTYTGSCTSDRVYWSTNGVPPDCSTSRYFLATANTCQASAAALGSTGAGYYDVHAARYKPGTTRRQKQNRQEARQQPEKASTSRGING